MGAGSDGRTSAILNAAAGRSVLRRAPTSAAVAAHDCRSHSDTCPYGSLNAPIGQHRCRIGNQSLVSRAAPFPRIVGERRQVWSIDEEIRKRERNPDGRLGSPGKRFQRVAGIHDRVYPTGFEATKECREISRLRHRLAHEDVVPTLHLRWCSSFVLGVLPLMTCRPHSGC